MKQKALNFSKDCINNYEFLKIKGPVSIHKIDIKRILLSPKHSYGDKVSLKYFIGYTLIGNAFPK